MTWHPIDDPEHPAPRDGKPIQVHNGRHYGVASWAAPDPRSVSQFEPHWYIAWATYEDHDYNNCYLGPQPTHWMPLQPPPPEDGK